MSGQSEATPSIAERSRHWRWRAAFVVAMFGAAGIGMAVGRPRWMVMLLLLLPVLFALPMWHEAQQKRAQQGEPSRALAEYDLRTLVAVFAYIFVMGGSVGLGKAIGPDSPFLWAVALAPAIPILFVIGAMARYLAEETDEFLRHRTINAALIATGTLLVFATVWGFFEFFKLVPHAPGWLAVPAFVVARDLAKAWLKARGQ